jgi:hypothetical protein
VRHRSFLLKIVLIPLVVLAVAGSIGVARGAPLLDDLTVDGDLLFPNPAIGVARDIHTVGNAGGLRIYNQSPTLTTSPTGAAIQFFANASNFPGQAFVDSGAHNSAAVIFRTTAAGGTITERMRINASGFVGIGTDNPLVYFDFKAPSATGSTNAFRLRNSADGNLFSVDDGGHVVVGAFRTIGATSHVCQFNGELTNCGSAAEYVPTIDAGHGAPRAADLVSIVTAGVNPHGDGHAPFVVSKAAAACDPNLFGFLLNPESGADGLKLNDEYLPLAIYGYFPARVTVENGAIKRGDAITSSSTPGAGMKATGACRTIGYALEDADQDGTIHVFAHLGDSSAGEVASLRAQMQEKDEQIQAMREQNAAMEVRLAALERTIGTTPLVQAQR